MKLQINIATSLAAILCTCLNTTLLADATGHGPLAPLNEPKPVEGAPTEQLGLGFMPIPNVVLGDIDLFTVLQQDDRTAQPAPMRIGISQEVSVTVDDGQWVNVDGGRVWRIEISGFGSLFNRLHLSGVMLEPGEKLYLVSGNGTEVAGPILARGEFENGEAWASSRLANPAALNGLSQTAAPRKNFHLKVLTTRTATGKFCNTSARGNLRSRPRVLSNMGQ